MAFKEKVTIELEDRASGKAKAVQSSFQRLQSFLASKFVFTLGDIQRGIDTVFGAIQSSITLERQEQALRGQLASIGQDFDTFIGTLKNVSKNTVATADLISASSRALLLGIPADEIGSLLEIAASRAAVFGKTTAEAFDDITEGIGKVSPQIIDNLGFVKLASTAYEKMAAEVGGTAETLTELQKKQAILNEVLEQGTATVGTFGGAFADAGTALEQTGAAVDNFKAGANSLIGILGTVLLGVVTGLTAAFVGLGLAVANTVEFITSLAAQLPGIGEKFDGVAGKSRKLSEILGRSFEQLSDLTDKLSDSANAQTDAFFDLSEAQEVTATSAANLAKAQDNQRESSEAAAKASQAYIDEMTGITASAEPAAEATKQLADTVEEGNTAFREGRVALSDYEEGLISLGRQYEQAAKQAASFTSASGGGPISLGTGNALRPSQFSSSTRSSTPRRADGSIDRRAIEAAEQARLAQSRSLYIGNTYINVGTRVSSN